MSHQNGYLWCLEGIKNFQVYGCIGFQSKVKLKYETEKYTCTKNNNLDMFRKLVG